MLRSGRLFAKLFFDTRGLELRICDAVLLPMPQRTGIRGADHGRPSQSGGIPPTIPLQTRTCILKIVVDFPQGRIRVLVVHIHQGAQLKLLVMF